MLVISASRTHVFCLFTKYTRQPSVPSAGQRENPARRSKQHRVKVKVSSFTGRRSNEIFLRSFRPPCLPSLQLVAKRGVSLFAAVGSFRTQKQHLSSIAAVARSIAARKFWISTENRPRGDKIWKRAEIAASCCWWTSGFSLQPRRFMTLLIDVAGAR